MADFPVIIVGGSLAGTSAALVLARHGVESCIIDAEDFPRRKACGEGLTLCGVTAVQRLLQLNLSDGVPQDRLPFERMPLRGFALHKGNRRFFVPATRASAQAQPWGISRLVLDNKLLQAARATGLVTFRPRESVRAVHGNQSHGTTSCQVTTTLDTITSDFVLLAGGVRGRSLVPFFSGNRTPPLPKHRVGGSLHMRILGASLPLDQVSVWIEDGCEWYVTPVAPDKLNVALLGSKDAMRQWHASRSNGSFSDVLSKRGIVAEPIDDIRGAHSFGGSLPLSSEGSIFYAGDLLESMDPIGGMGMTHALLSGEAAGYALAAILTKGVARAKAASNYDRERRRISLPLRGFTSMILTALVASNSNLTIRALQALGAIVPISSALKFSLGVSRRGIGYSNAKGISS